MWWFEAVDGRDPMINFKFSITTFQSGETGAEDGPRTDAIENWSLGIDN
jgi:hypothetical protein